MPRVLEKPEVLLFDEELTFIFKWRTSYEVQYYLKWKFSYELKVLHILYMYYIYYILHIYMIYSSYYRFGISRVLIIFLNSLLFGKLDNQNESGHIIHDGSLWNFFWMIGYLRMQFFLKINYKNIFALNEFLWCECIAINQCLYLNSKRYNNVQPWHY